MKPLIRNTQQVQAILKGATQFRQAIKPAYKNDEAGFMVVTNQATGERWVEKYDEEGGSFDTPRYVLPKYRVGDILWVRETFAVGAIACGEEADGANALYISQCAGENDIVPKEYTQRHNIGADEVIWKPSIFMPKEATCIFLKVTGVRVERLQEITTEDICNEGVWVEPPPAAVNMPVPPIGFDKQSEADKDKWYDGMARSAYIAQCDHIAALHRKWETIWDSTIKPINRDKYGWAANPWVWVCEFERTESGE